MRITNILANSYSYTVGGKTYQARLVLADPESIHLTPDDVYIRQDRDEGWVVNLEQMIDEGVEFEPVVVVKEVEGLGSEVLLSGNHRVLAYRKRKKEIPVILITEKLSFLEFSKLQRVLNPSILGLTPHDLKAYAIKLYRRLKGSYDGKEELIKTIAEIVGRSRSTIYHWLTEELEKEQRERIKKVQELKEQGLTNREIAKEVGFSERHVIRLLKENMEGGDKNPETGKMSLPPPSSTLAGPQPALSDEEERDLSWEKEWEEAVREERKEKEKGEVRLKSLDEEIEEVFKVVTSMLGVLLSKMPPEEFMERVWRPLGEKVEEMLNEARKSIWKERRAG